MDEETEVLNSRRLDDTRLLGCFGAPKVVLLVLSFPSTACLDCPAMLLFALLTLLFFGLEEVNLPIILY